MIIFLLAVALALIIGALATVAWLNTAGDAHRWVMRDDVPRPSVYANAPGNDPGD